jgi:TRAP-type C4-dicarboxylate transport system permease small subunit
MSHARIITLKRGLICIEKWIASASLLLLLLFVLTQIIARNFFNTGFPVLDIISRHLVLFITFMGAALISEQNNHIKIDILSTLLPAEQKRKLVRPAFFLSAVVCAFFSWYSTQFWLDEWHYAPAREQWIVLFALILPLGFSVLFLHLLLLTVTDFEHQRAGIDT